MPHCKKHDFRRDLADIRTEQKLQPAADVGVYHRIDCEADKYHKQTRHHELGDELDTVADAACDDKNGSGKEQRVEKQ